MSTKNKRPPQVDRRPKIEKGVKMPPRSGGGREPSLLTEQAAQMKVGDSLVGGSPSTATQWNIRYKPKRFSARIVAGKRRIWRTA